MDGGVGEHGKSRPPEVAVRGRDLTPTDGVSAASSAPGSRPGGVSSTTAAGVTPSMAQFLEIKAANPDCILWYRMGDFYELFFEDAVAASEVLGIVLTKRGKHLGQDIPMCGVPVHRADEYLQRLIRRGYRVAVCEQLEDPSEARKRGSKAVVRRDVVRVVTPGTLTEESLLDARARNFLTALYPQPTSSKQGSERQLALASIDISTGEFEVGVVSAVDLPGELARLGPSEILLPDTTFGEGSLTSAAQSSGAATTPVAMATFDAMAGERLLKERLGVAELGGFGEFGRGELAAIGALLRYIDLTQIGAKSAIRSPRRTGPSDVLLIDAASRTSLELIRSSSGERLGSLLAALDLTVTGAGSRELSARVATPLRDLKSIVRRLDAVGFLVERASLRDDIRKALRTTPDIARAVSRIMLGRGSPRDLGLVRDGLAGAALVRRLLAEAGCSMGLSGDLAPIASRLTCASDAPADQLGGALVDEPGLQKREGGFVRPGYRADLDEALRLRDDSRRVMASLEARYVAATGIKSLKVRHNNILGYYIETTALNAKPLQSPPHAAEFRHRQTMANAMRFTTNELEKTQERIASAAETALAIELEVFAELEAAIRESAQVLGGVASALAELDCLAGLAELAEREGYVRPELDTGTTFEILGGRHPVVEQALKAQKAGPFVENDCVLGRPLLPSEDKHQPASDATADGRIWLVTGPNMAGKSTFLRQNALIVVMAQMGSFVPARSARIGLVDRLFSRVGAADDLARGRSTFMVEMVETAGILNQATERSLVILDEIGRGTATFDGLSIAWATVEHLHEINRCRALFATHYHELTTLAGRLPEIANATIDVKEWHDQIVFLHKVKAGAADRSYGIQVAKLAGLPHSVIERAAEVLSVLEKGDSKVKGHGSRRGPVGAAVGSLEDLPLFAAVRPTSSLPSPREPSLLEQALSELVPDELSPKAALEAIYRLKSLVADGKGRDRG